MIGAASVCAEPAVASGSQVVGTLIGSAGFARGASTLSVSIAQADFDVPPSSGDMVILSQFTLYDSKTGSPPAIPAGFTLVAAHVGLGGTEQRVWYKIAGGSEGTYTTTGSPDYTRVHMHAAVIRGVTTPDSLSNFEEGTSTDPITNAGFTITGDYGVLYVMGYNNSISNTILDPTGFTGILTTGSSSWARSAVKQLTANGATGSVAFTESGTWVNAFQMSFMVHLR